MNEYHEHALKWQEESGGEIMVLGDRLLELHIVKSRSEIAELTNFAAFPRVNGRSFAIRLDLSILDKEIAHADPLTMENDIKSVIVLRLLEDVFEAAEGALGAKEVR